MPTTPVMSNLPDIESKRKRDNYDTETIQGHTRKRSNLGLSVQPILGTGNLPIPQPGSQSASFEESPSALNYSPRPVAERLALVPGDKDTFGDVLHLVGEYEAILERQESLAAALGAKLTGPLFLRRIEKFFEGPIKTSTTLPYANPISWLDVVAFAKASPADFYLTAQPNGTRTCRFVCKGLQVEITEDDWRLISSGALDRFPLEHPFEEDETAELATLDIVEQRTKTLYKKAEEVTARAKTLHYKLGLRKNSISQRQNSRYAPGRFQAINSSQRGPAGNASYDLHSDLLQQFVANTALLNQSRSNSGAGVSAASPAVPASPASHTHKLSGSGRSVGAQEGGMMISGMDAQSDVYRSLVTQKTESLAKGDSIAPPCDRCRRLRLSCLKHLTACQGCTKKHAKCSWRNVTDEEVHRLMQEMGVVTDPATVPGAHAETEATISRSSLPPRIAGEKPSRAGSMAGHMAAEAEASSDVNRTDPTIGVMSSPTSAPPGPIHPDASLRRQSVALGYEASYGPSQSSEDANLRRASAAARMPSSANSEPGASLDEMLNPPR